jgi:hypothetical protein
MFQLPIRTINFSDPADKARHDRMVALVTQMLDLNLVVSDRQGRCHHEKNSPEFFAERLQDASLDHDKELLTRQVEATDASIDKLVYELYGLTEEEITIVEGKGK